MYYRRFGKTELQMPVFTCGGMRYQHQWQDTAPEDIPKKNQENLEKAMIEKGVATLPVANPRVGQFFCCFDV